MAIIAAANLVPMSAWAAFGFGSPGIVNTNAATDSGHDTFPQLATDGAGNWVAIWVSADSLGGTIGTDQDILFSRSVDNGATWSPPAALNTNANSDSGNDIEPQIGTDGLGTWLAVWTSADSLSGAIGTDYDLLFSRSTDNGATWSVPSWLNSGAPTDTEWDINPNLVRFGGSNWIVAWTSGDSLGGTIGTDDDIVYSRSTDGGVSWSSPAALNTNATTDTGSDAAPRLATDGSGNLVAVWWSNEDLGGAIGTDIDILVARSATNGTSWSAPASINPNAVSDTMLDLDPHVATDGAGTWVAAWWSQDSFGGTIGTDGDIIHVRSTDNGATWSAPAPLNTNAAADSLTDSAPFLVAEGSGNWVALWHSNDSIGGTLGTDYDILIARSTDDGATWTAPAALNSTAATDSGNDQYPRLVGDGSGNWMAIWNSGDTMGGTLGTDLDILVSTSSTLPVELDVFGVE